MTNTKRFESKKKTAAATVAFLVIAGGCSNDPVEGKSIVLVHGAWNGAWAWSEVKSQLEDRGAKVTAVELPGHGADMTPISQITMRSYIDTVEAAIDAMPKPVILVGHSMGGIVVTQAADERASSLDRLIYVTAFVPKAGDSLLSLAMQDPDSELGASLIVQMTRGTAAVATDKIIDVFCADCDSNKSAELMQNYRDEPLEPFTEPAVLSAGGYDSVRKFYLYAADDHAISPTNQGAMTSGIEWEGTATVETSHSPFLSQPGEVTAHISDFEDQ